jgi:hypothetical protein
MNPAEVQAALVAFQALEPEVQRGIVGLIHLFHKKPADAKAQAYLAKAAALLAAQPPLLKSA